MRMICGVTMGEIGSESCECCASHRRCYSYKIAKEKLMAQSSVAMIRATQSFDEERMRGKPLSSEKNSEKNPKQVLIDWVAGVQRKTEEALKILDKSSGYSHQDAREYATQDFMEILGWCKAITVVLNNSD